jgi:GT2 family glycosyltransferase
MTSFHKIADRARRFVRRHPWLTPAMRAGGRVLRRAGLNLGTPAGGLPARDYAEWVAAFDTLTDADRAAIGRQVATLRDPPLISVVMPAYETPAWLLRGAIASLQAQLYPHWELCVCDDASPSSFVGDVLAEASAADPRVKWMRRETNGHIAAATNSALELAGGAFVALMDHDDVLPEHALYEVALEILAHPEVELIYTDEDKVDESGRRFDPYFKPDFSPELLHGQNLISHLGVYSRGLIERIGGFRPGYEGSQDYDLALRAARAAGPGRIRHIPAVLYHWRQMGSGASFSQAQLDRCVAAARSAIADDLAVSGVQGAEVLPAPLVPNWTRIRWPLPDPAPQVSIAIVARDGGALLLRCVAAALSADYPAFDLLVLHDAGLDAATLAALRDLAPEERLRLVAEAGARSPAARANAAIRHSPGEVVVLLDPGIEAQDAGWLREMVAQACRPGIGAVGAKLLFADGRVHHAGIALGTGAQRDGIGLAGVLGHLSARDDMGYYGQFALAREVSAVSGACIAMRRSVFEAVGGFDAEALPAAYHDVDLCLRLRAAGHRIIWTPFAELSHLDTASLGEAPDAAPAASEEAAAMRRRWGALLDSDPFFNPAFDQASGQFRFAFPPNRRKPWLRDDQDEAG